MESQLLFRSGSNVANLVASYLEPRQLLNWSGWDKITLYDASQHKMYPDETLGLCLHPSTTLTGYKFRLEFSMDQIVSRVCKLQRIVCVDRLIGSVLHSAVGVISIVMHRIYFSDLTHIPKFLKLEKITFEHCVNLNEFLINYNCPNIKTLTIFNCDFDCRNLGKFNDLRCVKISNADAYYVKALFEYPLRKIELDGIRCSTLVGFDGTKLRILIMKNMKIDDISCLANCNVRYLRLENCSISDIPQLGLKKLVVKKCPIKSFAFLLKCPNLECVKLEGCTVDKMSYFEACTKLKRIVLTNSNLVERHFDDAGTRFLYPVIIEHHNDVNHIMQMSDRVLAIDYAHETHFIRSNDVDEFHKDCTIVGLTGCLLKNLDKMILYKRLTMLHLDLCTELENMNGLRECRNLSAMAISRCSKLTDLSVLQECSKLKIITINSDMDVNNLTPLASCASLNALGILYWFKLRDLIAFPVCGVSNLELIHCANLINLDGLSRWDNLVTINIKSCQKLQSIPMLKKVKELSVSECKSLRSISWLEDVSSLRLLECANLENISELFRCEKLVDLFVDKCEKINAEELKNLREIVAERYRRRNGYLR